MDFSAMEEKLASLFLEIENNRRSVIIDVTDTYFTGDSLDSRPGKGKEGRIKKLMQIALVVTEKRGFPLFHRVCVGNVSNRTFRNRTGYRGNSLKKIGVIIQYHGKVEIFFIS